MPAPPNVLLVIADQLAATALPGLRQPRRARARTCERLGDEGVVFERALLRLARCACRRGRR